MQAAARFARYRLLGDWCREHACLHLLTGHHRDDQIETHLIRRRAQSGPDGLAGMSAIRELADCRLLRPLLGFERARLVAFLKAERQPFIYRSEQFRPRLRAVPLAARGGQLGRGRPRAGGRRDQRIGLCTGNRERERNTLFGRFVGLHPAGFALVDPAVLAEPSPKVEALFSSLTRTIGGAAYPPRRERTARLCAVLGAPRGAGILSGGAAFAIGESSILVTRELAKAEAPLGLLPGQRVVWDRRFEIRIPPHGASRFTIGYAGAAARLARSRHTPAAHGEAAAPARRFFRSYGIRTASRPFPI